MTTLFLGVGITMVKSIICDAAGGIYVFDGKSGEVIWSQGQVHEGGILSAAIPVN